MKRCEKFAIEIDTSWIARDKDNVITRKVISLVGLGMMWGWKVDLKRAVRHGHFHQMKELTVNIAIMTNFAHVNTLRQVLTFRPTNPTCPRA